MYYLAFPAFQFAGLCANDSQLLLPTPTSWDSMVSERALLHSTLLSATCHLPEVQIRGKARHSVQGGEFPQPYDITQPLLSLIKEHMAQDVPISWLLRAHVRLWSMGMDRKAVLSCSVCLKLLKISWMLGTDLTALGLLVCSNTV